MEAKWYHPLSHWSYFLVFVVGQAIVVVVLWVFAVWSALRFDFTAAFKAALLVQFIYVVSAGLFWVFRLLAKLRWLNH